MKSCTVCCMGNKGSGVVSAQVYKWIHSYTTQLDLEEKCLFTHLFKKKKKKAKQQWTFLLYVVRQSNSSLICRMLPHRNVGRVTLKI